MIKHLKALIKPVGFDCFKKLNKVDKEFYPWHILLYQEVSNTLDRICLTGINLFSFNTKTIYAHTSEHGFFQITNH